MGSGGLVTLIFSSSCASGVEEGQLQTCLPGDCSRPRDPGSPSQARGISLSLPSSSSHPQENHSGLPSPPRPELQLETLLLQRPTLQQLSIRMVISENAHEQLSSLP